MPLKANFSGAPVIASLLDDPTWHSLRDRGNTRFGSLRLSCCGEIAYPRVSKLGTRHFAHRIKGGCESKPETAEHLFIKSELALGCHDAGYQVDAEAAGEGWRADVLATRGNLRIALEIQWSRQTYKETVLRQERYAKSEIIGAWIFRRIPYGLALRSDLPAFGIQLQDTASATIEGLPVRALAVRCCLAAFACVNRFA
jgi:competence CoiA-like predicted nuclease